MIKIIPQLLQIRLRIDLPVPTQLSQTKRAQMKRLAIRSDHTVRAIHVAQRIEAMVQTQYMRRLVSRRRQTPLQATLVHMLWAEWLWVRRWNGVSPKEPARTERFPDVAAIRAEWADIERRQQEFIDALSDERLLVR